MFASILQNVKHSLELFYILDNALFVES